MSKLQILLDGFNKVLDSNIKNQGALSSKKKSIEGILIIPIGEILEDETYNIDNLISSLNEIIEWLKEIYRKIENDKNKKII